MARIRSVKPEFWGDRKMARISRDARLLYIAIWNQCDEHARCQGDPRFIKGHCLPYDDDLSLTDIERLLDELARAGRLRRYEVDSDPYIYLPKLASHQRLEPEKVPSRLPEPPPVSTDSRHDDNPSESRADESAPGADQSADKNALLYVAGSREHVAGGRGVAPTESPRAARAPDLVWDALLDACGVDRSSVTASSRGAYNKATADLKSVSATPAEIHRRAAVYRHRWPDVSLTPTALVRRWAECDVSPPPRDSRTRTARQLDAAMERAIDAEAEPQHRKAIS